MAAAKAGACELCQLTHLYLLLIWNVSDGRCPPYRNEI